MNRFKKIMFSLFIVPFIFMLASNTNQADAAVGTHDVEKTFDMVLTANVPGYDEELPYGKLIFKATVPNVVKSGEEFYLTNVSYTHVLTFEEHEVPTYPVTNFFREMSFKVNSENETNTAMNFFPEVYKQEIPPYSRNAELIIGGDGVDVGPFIAGQEGHVVIKADSISFQQGWPGPDGEPVFGAPINLIGKPAEGSDLTVATIPIDGEAPVITLNGDNPMIVKQGDPYVEPGATAVDNFDGDVSNNIEISGDVDTSTIGTYTVTYTVSDSVGNVATVERTVNVVEPFGNWLTGEGPPSDELGFNGDSYLDLLTGDVYKRDPNTWTKVGNIKGDDGKQGSKILTGEGAPKADLGNVGDLYFDTKTGDVYEKTADGWVKIANLQGPAGPAGSKGPKGADGTGGTSGDGSGKDKQSKTGSSKVASKDAGDKKGSSAKGGKLPKTATSFPTLILVGALLVAAGTILFIRRRKVME